MFGWVGVAAVAVAVWLDSIGNSPSVNKKAGAVSYLNGFYLTGLALLAHRKRERQRDRASLGHPLKTK